MARIPTSKTYTFKARSDDRALIEKLEAKLKKCTSDVLRDAIRQLAKAHRVTATS